MINNKQKLMPFSINRAKFNSSPYDLLNSISQNKDKSKDKTKQTKQTKSSVKKNAQKQNQSQNAPKSTNRSKGTKKKQQGTFYNQNDSRLANLHQFKENKDRNVPKLNLYEDSQQESTSPKQYIEKIKSSYLAGQRKQETRFNDQSQEEQQNRYGDFFERKMISKEKYWPELQQIEEVAADLITTSQRKPGQSSKKKQKAIKSHRDPVKNNVKKQPQIEPILGLSQAIHHKKSIEIDSKQKNLRKTIFNTNKSFSNIPCNTNYTQLYTQQKKDEKIRYKKPTSLPRNSCKTKSQLNLNKKTKHLSIQSDARRRQSANSMECVNKNSEKIKYLSLSSKSKQLQRDRKYRDSSKQRSGSKNSTKTQRLGQNQKIKITAYQDLQNKSDRNQKNIKMLWNCIGELWQQSRITHYMSEKNQTKIDFISNKLENQEQTMIELKIRTSQLIASEINKSGRV